MTNTKTVEVVLPSGRFAACKNITVLDWLTAIKSSESIDTMAVLVVKCVTIDSEPVTLEDVLALPLEEYWPIINMLSKKIERARLTEEGIK